MRFSAWNMPARCGLLLPLLLWFAPAGAALERVDDFALLDQHGEFHQLSRYRHLRALAVMAYRADCPAMADLAAGFEELGETFGGEDIAFLYIDSKASDRAPTRGPEGGLPVLDDAGRLVSAALELSAAGEVALLNPRRLSLFYQGAAGAGFEDALRAVIGGALADSLRTDPPATCPIAYPLREAMLAEPPDYASEVAPRIIENCGQCHRRGGVGPFALDSYLMLLGWSPMIREVLMTRRMPPGQIDGHIGEFINDRLIDREDLRNIIAWVEAGAPVDGERDPLAELTWPESKWAFGEPDLVLDIPATTVPATGNGVFVNVSVNIDMEQDRWLRGSQIIAGDRSVLHHTVNRLDYPEEVGKRRGGFLAETHPDKADITAYIPGDTPDLAPPNTGGLLKAGSVLALNMHYTPNGRETVDNSQLGLWFYPEGEVPTERMSGRCACVFPNTWTTIPPHDPSFEQTASIVIERDARIHSYLPHMHFRGKSMRFYADYPDGTSEELINIAKYNYNWQLSYTYAEPKFVPAGTKITAVAAWDNSARNPMNPNPDRAVDWGNESWDEMFFGAVNWKYENQSGAD